jgi:rhodanese-related sulfurtransferase
MLERMGFQKLVNVVGGMAAWDAAHFESVVSQQ